MERRIFMIFVCLVTVMVALPFNAFAKTDGFKGIKWGTDISSLKGMVYVRTDPSYGGVKMYSRKGDELKIGSANLKSIEYGFWQNKLSSVRIDVGGLANYSPLKNATFEKFGRGLQDNQFMEEYAWFGEITCMLLEYSEIRKTGYLFIYSSKISEQQQLYDAKKAKQGAKSGF